MFNFNDHDRAVASTPERQQLDATLSRLTKAAYEDRAARISLMQAKTSAPHQMDSAHTKNLHREQLDELQKEADRCAHELEVAKAQTDHLKNVCRVQQIEGPRVEAKAANG